LKSHRPDDIYSEMNPATTSRVLVIDDEQGYRALLEWKLKARGLQIETVKNGEEALARLNAGGFDVVVTDLTMPKGDGLWVLEEIKKRWPATEVIIITGFGTVETAVRAMKLGAFDVIIKPFDLEPFLQTLLLALAKKQRADHEARGVA
jgi:DNA-binding NtrC family response regulator